MHTPGAPTDPVHDPTRDRAGDVDDDALRRIVRRAYLPPLLAALAQATGDLSLLRDDLRPDPARAREAQGGMSSEQREAARELALVTLKRVLEQLSDAAGAVGGADADALREMMAFTIGERVSDDYVALLLEELAPSGEDRRAPDWHKRSLDPQRPFRAVVVGAGMSGLVAAHRLLQAGIDVVVVEKNDDVGGTWLENHYPGCRVDVPNHLYSYSFAQRADWPQQFSPQAILLDYFRECADELDIREHIRFTTEVVRAEFCEATTDWDLSLRTPDGAIEKLRANVVVSAVGQLNRPVVPDIAGRGTFAGPAFHSAEWDDTVDLRAKRVAVVGTGASAIQLVPAIADTVAELTVFQRTPNWFMPTPQYYAPMPDEMQWLLARVPFYSQWYRFWLFWRLSEGALPAARVDPEWHSETGSVSALNDELRATLTQYIEMQFADAPEMLEQVVPAYPPLAKRILLDNGVWAATLKRDHVHLVTDRIDHITPTSIVTDDGREREVDVVVYATGFAASRFLTPMQIIGRNGLDLHEQWGDDARAYLGITVPGFPNLFCLYGPNTNLVANGSIIFFSECAVNYVVGCVRLLLDRGKGALDCRPEVSGAYNARVDAANAAMAWGASSVNSWYKNSHGRVIQNWPFSLLEFWERTRAPDPHDFELL
jgi:4-hydroxyacetophenone monooxygenase